MEPQPPLSYQDIKTVDEYRPSREANSALERLPLVATSCKTVPVAQTVDHSTGLHSESLVSTLIVEPQPPLSYQGIKTADECRLSREANSALERLPLVATSCKTVPGWHRQLTIPQESIPNLWSARSLWSRTRRCLIKVLRQDSGRISPVERGQFGARAIAACCIFMQDGSRLGWHRQLAVPHTTYTRDAKVTRFPATTESPTRTESIPKL